MDRQKIHSTVVGALRQTIKTHGPIESKNIGSAAKRIVGGIMRLIRTSENNNGQNKNIDTGQ